MRTLIWSDMHFHNWTYGSTLINGWNSRLLAQYAVMEEIGHSIIKNKVDQVVCCGDVFHTPGKIDTYVLNIVRDSLLQISLRIGRDNFCILVGNHDFASKDGVVNSLSWADKYAIIVHKTLGRLSDVFLAYTENKSDIEEAFQNVGEGGIAFLHQGVSNLPIGSGFVVPNEILSEEMIPAHVKRVFTGHYHKPHDGEKISVVGSPMQHNWGDADSTPRGWLIYDDETDTIERFESKAPKFIKLECGSSSSVVINPGSRIKNNYIKVQNFTGDKDKYRKNLINAGALSVEFEMPKVKIEPLPTSTIGFDLEAASDYYATTNGEGDKRIIKIGQEIREGKYEIPITDSE